jgi:oligopeptide transport system substrate-binding protein
MSGWNSCSGARPQAPGSESGGISQKSPRALVVSFTLLVLTFLPGCARQSAAPEGILRLSQRNEPSVLDPALATLPDEFFILRGLLEGLVTPDPDGGEPLPAAAERWTISPDGRTYTFTLRPDGRWSNGEPVTASDFIASYRRALTPSTAAPKANLFFLVEGAEAFYRGTLTDFAQTGFSAPDNHTLAIRLTRPTPPFLAYVASGPWLPVNPRVVERHGANWTRPANFVGNGPFTLVEWRPQQRVVLARRPDHPDSDRVHVAALHFVAMDNGDAEERSFRAGQIDVTMSVPASKLAGYAEAEPSVLVRSPLHETRYLAFNTRRGPLADVRVRQALGLAIDRQALVSRVVLGGQRSAATYVPSGIGGYIPPAAPFSHDPAAARRLLAAAGFPGGAGFPTLEFTTWTNVTALETIQAMWKQELGIDVRLALREARVHLTNLSAGNYDIAFATAIPDVADAAEVLDAFRAGSPANYPHWQSAAFEAALETAAAAPNATARLSALGEAERLLLADAPVAPLYFSTRNYLVSPRVQGWREDTLWNRFYLDVRIAAPR